MKVRFNWKHSLFHFLSLWFFAYGFMILGYLNNVKAAETIRNSTNDNEILIAASLSKIYISIAISFVVGYLIALIVAFVVSSKIKGAWINTLVAFIIFFILIRVNLTGWTQLKDFFLFFGRLFNGWSYYFINATILIVLGLFFLFRIKSFYNTKR